MIVSLFIEDFHLHTDDRGWSDWQPFSECKGIPCSTGRQRRIRTCLNPPTITNRPSCEGDQMQERECQMPCPSDVPSHSNIHSSSAEGSNRNDWNILLSTEFLLETDFSDWSPWTECQGVSCQMGQQQRMRVCLKLPKADGTKSVCNGEQLQERACPVSCLNQNNSISSPSVRPFSKGNH